MNIIEKLLKLNPLTSWKYTRYLAKKESTLKTNKNEILLLYRKILKLVPP